MFEFKCKDHADFKQTSTDFIVDIHSEQVNEFFHLCCKLSWLDTPQQVLKKLILPAHLMGNDIFYMRLFNAFEGLKYLQYDQILSTAIAKNQFGNSVVTLDMQGLLIRPKRPGSTSAVKGPMREVACLCIVEFLELLEKKKVGACRQERVDVLKEVVSIVQ